MTAAESREIASFLQSWAESIDKGDAVYVAIALRSAAEGLQEMAQQAEIAEMQYQQNQTILKGVKKCVARTAGLKRKLQKYSLAQ